MTANWRMAFRNLQRNKRRNLATGIAMAIGFAAFLAIGGYINRVEKYLRIHTIYGARTGHVVIYKKDGFENFYVKPKEYSLSPADQAAISDTLREMSTSIGIDLHGGILQGQGLVGNGCRTFPFLAMGIDPLLDKQLREHPLVGRWTQKFKGYKKGRGISEFPPETGAIAVAEGLAHILHKDKVYDDFPTDHRPQVITDCTAKNLFELTSSDANVQLAAGTWEGMMSALDGEIVATFNTGFSETNSSGIVTALTHLQKLYETDHVTLYAIWLKDAGQLKSAVAALREGLSRRQVDVDIYTWLNEELAPFYTGTMSFLRTMVGFVTFILASVVILSIFNAATMTVIERAQEIGMMRSLGYTRQQIRQLFIREIVALSLLSPVGGAICAVIGIAIINRMNITFSPAGLAGSIQLLLDPNIETIIAATVVVPLLAVGTTMVAIRGMVNKPITILLMGSNR